MLRGFIGAVLVMASFYIPVSKGIRHRIKQLKGEKFSMGYNFKFGCKMFGLGLLMQIAALLIVFI